MFSESYKNNYFCGKVHTMSGKVVIFSAPSGAGKSTVVRHLLKSRSDLEFSVSATSRAPRGQERDGVEYHFLDANRFRELIAQDAFVEYEEVYRGLFYGTLKSEVERIWSRGHVILFDVDVKGGVSLKKRFGDAALSVLIVPPDMAVLEDRLRKRGTDGEEAIRERLAKAASELAFAAGRFDRTIVNDKLEDTLARAEALVAEFLCA